MEKVKKAKSRRLYDNDFKQEILKMRSAAQFRQKRSRII